MACYHPLTGYRSREVNLSGKRSIVFNLNDGFPDLPVQLPCGQCIGCRLEKSRQWAVRCVNEAQLHQANAFITLTFDETNLCREKTLIKSDFQKFMKRLRISVPEKIRYFHCGEYGEQLNRPHHHAIIFGYDFPDKILYTERNGIPLYISKTLGNLWPFGFSSIGEVNFETAAYVARYTLKKKTGEQAADHYGDRLPPYNTMSLKPGIGADWLTRFESDVYPSDEVMIRRDVKCKPPKYYDDIYDGQHPEQMVMIKKRRYAAARKRAADNTPERLEARELCKQIQTKQLVRSFDET